MQVKITLPLPPSTNELIGKSQKGRKFYGSKKKNMYFNEVFYLLHNNNLTKLMLKKELEVKVKFYIKRASCSDIDNRFKALFDALTHAGIFKDDSQICKLSSEKHKSSNERAVIEINEIENFIPYDNLKLPLPPASKIWQIETREEKIYFDKIFKICEDYFSKIECDKKSNINIDIFIKKSAGGEMDRRIYSLIRALRFAKITGKYSLNAQECYSDEEHAVIEFKQKNGE